MRAAQRRIVSEVKGLLHEALVPNLKDEIQFWSQQFSEHADLMAHGLVHTELRDRAIGLRDEWEEFRSNMGGKTETIALKEMYAQCDMLRAFKTECIERQIRGEWIGWLGPGLIDHMRDEIDYFVFAVSDELSEKTAVSKWCEFISEHAATLGHMIDDSQRKLVVTAIKTADEMMKYQFRAQDGFDEKLVAGAVQESQKFDQWIRTEGIGTRKVRSVVPPALTQHMLREGQRFVQVMHLLEFPET
jgi:hypothetical protein